VLGVLLVGYSGSGFTNLPVPIVAVVVAIVFVVKATNSEAVDTTAVMTGAPWAIVCFSTGRYVVVFGLRNAELTDVLASVMEAVDTKAVLTGAPWASVLFSIGRYVVVFARRNARLTDVLARVIEASAEQGLFVATIAMGFVAAILSSIMNNMPTVMIDAIAIA